MPRMKQSLSYHACDHFCLFFFSSRRRHTRFDCDWSSDVCSSDLPAGYWPEQDAPPDAAAWETSVGQVERDLRGMERLVADPKTDLFARIPHGTGQTVLREALVLADHNSYHLGQLVLLRRLLGAWKKG